MNANGHNGHSKRKLNGQRTLQCVERAIEKCRCNRSDFFATAFALAVKHKDAPEKFDVAKQVEWFAALALLDYSRMPDGYTIPRCVLLLADDILVSERPQSLFSELQGLRKQVHSVIPLTRSAHPSAPSVA